jgi:RimJ/RimL family protein N-acetyltransferase
VELTRTPRLLLRRWEESDLEAFFDLYSRDDVMRWLGPQPRRALATMDEARERLARWVAGTGRLDRPRGLWAMVPLSPVGEQPGAP